VSAGTHSLELTGIAGDPRSPVHRLDPRAKILAFAGITLAAVTAPLTDWLVYALAGTMLLGIAVAARIPAGAICSRARWAVPFVLVVVLLLPLTRSGGATYELGPLAIHDAGLAIAVSVAAKSAIGVLSAVLLVTTTSFPDTLRGLEAMRTPRVLVMIASFMYRYLFVIAEDVGRMRAALASRGYQPRHALQVAALGRVATALFLRTYERGERVHLAMLARGYRGEMPELEPLVLRRADAAFATAVLVALVSLRIAMGGLP
jgi:cobalt/nickel transport system permease protein